jgi:hypothetical protein
MQNVTENLTILQVYETSSLKRLLGKSTDLWKLVESVRLKATGTAIRLNSS